MPDCTDYFGIILPEEEPEDYEEYIPEGYYFIDDLDGGRLVKKEGSSRDGVNNGGAAPQPESSINPSQ